jgi:hypothetical protein
MSENSSLFSFFSFTLRSAHSEVSVKFLNEHTHTHTHTHKRERERILLAWRLLHLRTFRPWRREREREEKREREIK